MAIRKSGVKPRSQRRAEEVDLGFSWGILNSFLLGLGVLMLVLGYLTLSRGSISLAPVLLVIGYCVVIPAAIGIRGRDQGSGE